MKCKAIITLITILFFSIAHAQTQPRIPRITTDPGNKPIELKKLQISVFVIDNIATTTMEMEFFNDNNRIMEGELNFPLGNGVTVSRFALDVNGEMREGVVVEKEKATQVFEAVSRQKVDPGIVEVTKGNNFKARVYPIPAKGYKKAIIAFEEELTGDNKDYIYQLPLNFKQKLDEFGVTVEVVLNKPTVVKNSHPNINLNFQESKNSFISNYSEKNIELNSNLAFSIPKPTEVKEVITYKGSVTSDNYFYVNINLKEESKEKDKPSKVAIIWDASTSGKDRDIAKEIAIIEEYISWMETGNIQLKTFSNREHETKYFKVKSGKCDELITYLKATDFDGGTNLSAINCNDIKADEILFFTDGISNFGAKEKFYSKTPVITINSSNIADHNLLEYIASSSNGVYADAFSKTHQEIMKLLTHQQKRFIKATYEKGNISEFYPANGQLITNNFSCSGIAEGSKNNITLHFGFGNIITDSYTITIDNTKRVDNNLGERIWAQKKLKALLIEDDSDKIKKHGKKFSLVTTGTSLIVLDNLSDYVRYEIIPPKSMQDQYNQQIMNRNKNREASRKSRIQQVCQELKNDYTWWKNNIDPKKIMDKEQPRERVQANSNALHYAEEPQIEAVNMMYADAPQEESAMRMEESSRMMASEGSNNIGFAAGFSGNSSSPSMMAKSSLAKKKAEVARPQPTSTMKLRTWDSNAPYMSDLKATDAKELYKTYLTLKLENSDNPSFYFDVATYLFQKNQRDAGLRVISNLAELELENAEIMRTLGRKLYQYSFYSEAIEVFKEVMKARSFEPHSYIDLGLTYAEKGEYQKAIETLYTVVNKEWDNDISSRFPGIEVIVLHDINNIIKKHKKEVTIDFIEECFIENMPVNVRVIIDWDANDTDIDLWVTDPRGEKCSYQNKNTKLGGRISNDITRGYGPEEFRLKKAISGDYKIEVNFYGTSKQTVLGNVTIRAIVYTNFGNKNEHKEVLTLQLEPQKRGVFTIGEITFKE